MQESTSYIVGGKVRHGRKCLASGANTRNQAVQVGYLNVEYLQGIDGMACHGDRVDERVECLEPNAHGNRPMIRFAARWCNVNMPLVE